MRPGYLRCGDGAGEGRHGFISPPALSLVVGLAIGLWPLTLSAANPDLPQAMGLYEEMRYQEAYTAFRDALTRRGNAPEEIASIYMHLGIVAAYLGRQQEAVDYFQRWLCVYPDAELADGLSPKVTQPFEEAHQRAAGNTSFKLVHIPASRLPDDGGLDVEAELLRDSLGLASGLTLRYRPVDAPSFSELHREGDGRLFFSVSPAELPPGKDVEYYLQIRDAYGGVLWQFGSERAPIRASAPVGAHAAAAGGAPADDEEDEAVFYTQPWFFVAAGATAAVVLAGGITAVAVAVAAGNVPDSAAFGAVRQEVANAR